MAWLPALGALLVVAVLAASIGFVLRHRRARRTLEQADTVLEGPGLHIVPDELLTDTDLDADAEPVLLSASATRAILAESYDPVSETRAQVGAARHEHEKATVEFSAYMDDRAELRQRHEAPTREFSAYTDAQEQAVSVRETTPSPTPAATIFEEDDGERTCVFKPDMELLDHLRGDRTERPRAPALSERPPAPALSERPRAPALGERPPMRSERPPMRSESFYIQSNVQSEERVVQKRAPSRQRASGDTKTSGFAPSARPRSGTQAVGNLPPLPRQLGKK